MTKDDTYSMSEILALTKLRGYWGILTESQQEQLEMDFDAYAQAAVDAALADLFQSGQFELHSGEHTTWKIDCDALSDTSIETLAHMVSDESGGFGSVEGVPSGGLRLAKALEKYATDGPVLIMDDVLTTGASMEEQRAGRDAIGAVIFARGSCPGWVRPLFIRPDAALADTLGLLEALRERYGTPVSIGRRFFMSSTEIIIDGIGYTRAEVEALLAGKEKASE